VKSNDRNAELEGVLDSLIGPHGAENQHGVAPSQSEQPVISFSASRQYRLKLEAEGYTHSREFVILPSRKTPRWLLPIGKTGNTMKGFDIYVPYARVGRILKSITTSLFWGGWVGRPQNRVLVSSSNPLALEELVREVTGECQPEFSLSLGTPGQFRKVTIQVMGRNGEVLGYVKLPLTEAAKHRIRHEASILGRLENSTLRCRVPRVLYAGAWGDSHILFESALDGDPGPTVFTSQHRKLLDKMRDVHFVCKPGSKIVEEVGRRWGNTVAQLGLKWRELGDEILCRSAELLRSTSVPCGLTHGDFAPWNSKSNNGELFLFDWESADEDAPLEWDLFHFQVQTASCLRRQLPACHGKDSTAGAYLLYLLYSVARLAEAGPTARPAIDYRETLVRNQLHQRLAVRLSPNWMSTGR
jgi:hypothetical protein